MGNFCAGKTMLERYARSAQAQDDIMQRMLNSGIQDDASILNDYHAMQNKPNYNDSLMMAGKGGRRATGQGQAPPPTRSAFCNMAR